MSSKIKKIISGLMCMALLAVYAVPVNAAQYMEDMGLETASACKHVHIDITYDTVYTSTGSITHRKVKYENYTCMDCNTLIRSYRADQGLENHSWTYRDLGHVELSHNYEVVCRNCYHTEKTSVPCPNKNGPHKTPF